MRRPRPLPALPPEAFCPEGDLLPEVFLPRKLARVMIDHDSPPGSWADALRFPNSIRILEAPERAFAIARDQGVGEWDLKSGDGAYHGETDA